MIAFVFFLSVLQGVALLFSGFSYRKSGVIIIFVLMYITCIFSLAAFKVSSLSLFLSNLIMMYLRVVFFMFLVLRVLQAS